MNHNDTTSLVVKHDFKGKRIDQYLVSRLQEYSRSFIQGLIRNGDVMVCGRTTKNSYEVQKDDVITVQLPEFVDDEVEPQNIPLDVVFEDDYILVINKPPDMVVHPARGHSKGTLVNAIKYYCNNLSELNGNLRPGIVHRLDRDTTGIIVVAKSDQGHGIIARQFESRVVKKEYIAVVEGRMDFDADIIELPIGRHKRTREKMAVRYDNGKPGTSRYEVVERFARHTVVKVFPATGRTHQIRVHMQHIGHPVVADLLYGNANAVTMSDISASDILANGDGCDEKPIIARQALHAHQIEFCHPVSNEPVRFKADVPDDMSNLIDALRG